MPILSASPRRASRRPSAPAAATSRARTRGGRAGRLDLPGDRAEPDPHDHAGRVVGDADSQHQEQERGKPASRVIRGRLRVRLALPRGRSSSRRRWSAPTWLGEHLVGGRAVDAPGAERPAGDDDPGRPVGPVSSALRSRRSPGRAPGPGGSTGRVGAARPAAWRMFGAPKATTAVSPAWACRRATRPPGARAAGSGGPGRRQGADGRERHQGVRRAQGCGGAAWQAAAVSSTRPGTRPIR